jgi:hypothetical protein
MDDHNQVEKVSPLGGRWFKLIAFGIATTCVATGTGFLIAPRTSPPANKFASSLVTPTTTHHSPAATPQESGVPSSAARSLGKSSRLFRDWPDPDVAIVLTGQEHGYLQPCGCSEPQKGGLARRFNFLKLLKGRKWPVVAADLGDVAQKGGPQAKIKYVASMQALEKMNYTAVGAGENEGAIPLFDALGEFALNNPKPRVLITNLQNNGNFPGAELREVTKDSPIRIGFVGIVGPTVAQIMSGQDPAVKFDPAEKVLPGIIDELRKKDKPEFLVLLYQGFDDEAKNIAKQFPQFQVVLHATKEEEPSARPQWVDNTLVVSVGHKGRFVGVVGVNRTNDANKPFQLHYELVPLDPEYETPPGRDADNPIHKLLQDLAETLRAKNYLANFPTENKHAVQFQYPNAEYIGSDSCENCHKEAYQVWKNSPHPHAFDTLVNKAKRPTLRQFDGECVLCHVTGFTYKSGFSAGNQADELKGVTCESCHGPCSLHKEKPNDLNIRKAINPWKFRANKDPKALALMISDLCITCHDSDNDVHFKFEDYWEPKKIAHYTPKKK